MKSREESQNQQNSIKKFQVTKDIKDNERAQLLKTFQMFDKVKIFYKFFELF